MKTTREIRIFITYIILGITANVVTVSLPLVFVSKDISAAQLATILSVSFLGAFFQPIFGIISDNIKHPKYVVLCATIIMSFGALVLFSTNNFYIMVLTTLIISTCNSACFSILDSITSLISFENNFNFGLLRSGGSIGYGIALFLMLPIIIYGGGTYALLALAMFSLVCALLVFFVDDSVAKQAEQHYIKEVKNLAGNSDYIFIVIISIFIASVAAMRVVYQTIILDQLNISIVKIAIVGFVMVIPEVLFLPRFDKYLSGVKFTTLMLIANTILIIQLVAYYFSASFGLLVTFASFHGLVMCIYIPSTNHSLRSILPSNVMSTAYLIRSMLTATFTFLVSKFIIGKIYDLYGVNNVFLTLIGVSIIGFIPILILRYKNRSARL